VNTARPLEKSGRRSLTAPSATVWGYIRHELLFLGFALMELALITPVVMVILSWARYWPAYQIALWLLLLMLLPLNLVRLMGLVRVELKYQYRVLIIALLATIVLSWRLLLYNASSLLDFGWLGQFAGSLGEGGNLLWTRDLSVFLVTAFMWWRGIRLASRYPEINNVGLRLRLGGLIFLPLVVWFGNSFLDISVVPFVLMFFLAGLTVVSLVRAENIEQERSGTAATLNARWFVAVFGAALGIILAGGILSAFVAGESLFTVIAWLAPFWRALQFGATVAGVTLLDLAGPALDVSARLVQLLAAVLALILRQVSAGLRQAGFGQDLAPPVLPTPEATPGFVIPEVGTKAITVVIMLGLIVLVAWGLARAYRQASFAARESERSQIGRNTEAEETGLGRRLLNRLGLLRQWRVAASVRRIYRLTCRAAAEAGYPRLGSETPYEFLPTLARVWPDLSAETRLITEAFVRVRYGEIPETEEELEAIRAAWSRVEAAQPHRREVTTDSGPKLAKRE